MLNKGFYNNITCNNKRCHENILTLLRAGRGGLGKERTERVEVEEMLSIIFRSGRREEERYGRCIMHAQEERVKRGTRSACNIQARKGGGGGGGMAGGGGGWR